jgi:hypothetical protein
MGSGFSLLAFGLENGGASVNEDSFPLVLYTTVLIKSSYVEVIVIAVKSVGKRLISRAKHQVEPNCIAIKRHRLTHCRTDCTEIYGHRESELNIFTLALVDLLTCV